MQLLFYRRVLAAASFLLLAAAYADTVSFEVVGVYDEDGQGNSVDKSAMFYAGNSMGTGADESLIIGVEPFRDEVRAAFSNGCGGVVSFDNSIIVGGMRTDTFEASFGGEKTLIVKSVDHLRTDLVATNICIPLSSSGVLSSGGYLAKSNVNGDQISIRSSFDFTFTESGFSKGEHVHAVGGTILARDGGRPSSKWLMKVLLDNDDMIASIADINFRTGKSNDDTFFGARAPVGRYIVGVAWICLDGSFSGLDGLAFITDGAVAESPAATQDVLQDDGSSTNGAASTNEDYSLLFGY